MAESSVNNIDGIPFWGHGTEENLLAGITPTQDETEEKLPEDEWEKEDATPDDGDEEEAETEPSSE